MTQNSIVKEKALVEAFSVITNLRMDLRFKFQALSAKLHAATRAGHPIKGFRSKQNAALW